MMQQLKPILMGAIFTLVAMGFAYAVPHAIQLEPTSDAGVSEVVEDPVCPTDEDSTEGETGDDLVVDGTEGETTDGETGEDPVVDETDGETTEGETGETGDDPVVDETETTEGETTEDESTDECEVEEAEAESELEPEDDDGEAKNHGQVVRVAAHCDVKGKAHGELVRSIAQDKDATKTEAEAACADAVAAAEAGEDVEHGKPAKDESSKGKPDHAGGKKDSEDDGSEGSDVGTSSGLETSSDVETLSAPAGKGPGRGKNK